MSDRTDRPEKKRHAGMFKPGQSGNPGGRPKGVGRATLIREAVVKALDAAHKDGAIGYLTQVAQTHPQAFLALVGKTMPVQAEHSGPDGGPIQQVTVTIVDPKAEGDG